jgi:PadR family transcriptional regulator PadR
MSKRDYLSEFEQLVMLAVLQLDDDAYGAKIRAILDESAARTVSIATIYVALGRLEESGLVRSWMSEPVAVRGGRSKRLYALEAAGVEALDRARATYERMWAQAEAARGAGR